MLVSNERRLKFEIDTQSLSRAEFLNEISKIKKNKIKIGTASWTPLETRLIKADIYINFLYFNFA